MLDIYPKIKEWVDQKKPFAWARVVRTWGSSPRPIGSALAISEDMEMAGSVSGGCVEGAVLKEAMEILKSGNPRRLKFGVSDEEAWAVGLSCGGAIHVFTERFMAFDENQSELDIWKTLSEAVEDNKGCVLATAMFGEKNSHLLVHPDGKTTGGLEHPALIEAALKAYRERKNEVVELEDGSYFLHVFPPKVQMLIVGAAHITTDLVRLGNLYDFETVVIDPRGIFASKTQFPDPPYQLYEEWPAEVLPNYNLDEYTFAVLLTHDPKIDDQALHILLRSNVAYIGALGSRRTHEKRVKRLTAAGFSEEEIAKVHGPVGVDINAKRPKEIALSIMGEIIKEQECVSVGYCGTKFNKEEQR